MIFGVLGDVHGAHWRAIELVQGWRRKSGRKLDFLLQVGDFEPHRDQNDLDSMAAPQKYRTLGDFSQILQGGGYPVPLFFIGGNHEPYSWLETLPGGGEIGANCTYLGRAGAREIQGLRVAYLGGIWQGETFSRARPAVSQFGILPNKTWIGWNESDIETLLESGRAEVLVLHEWPLVFEGRGALNHDISNGESAKWLELVIESLRPGLTVCGHAHFRWSGSFKARFGAIPVECLGKVEAGRGALAVFEWRGNEDFREI